MDLRLFYRILGASCLAYFLLFSVCSRFGLSLSWLWSVLGGILLAAGALAANYFLGAPLGQDEILSILTELERDYVRTSYSRGNSRRTTLYRHVLRNAVPATVTFLAMTVADIVAGSVVIEQVFAIPGLGRLLLSSISGRDYPVVQAVVVILAFWVVLVNLIADLINQRLDPRLRLS